MKAEKKFAKNLKKRFAKKQNEMRRQPGEMGDGIGGLIVPGLGSFIYVTIGDKALPVFNNRVAPQIGVKVWVGYAPEEPTLFQVLSTRSETPAGVEQGFVGYAPARRYEWHAVGGGQDPLNVHLRAFTPLKLGVSNTENFLTLYVDLYRGFVWTGTAYLAVPRQDIDLFTHIPTTAGKAALVLITIDDTGAVIQTKGSEVDIDALVLADLPAIPADTVFVCGAVRVYEGQVAVQEGRTNTDFWDGRFPGYFTGGGGGLVVGLWDDRGNFDASVNAYPSSGGSGTAGAILKGDIWTVSVAGTLPTGQAVEVGDTVRALVDTPGNTQANWAIAQQNIGYVAENSANKSTDVNTDQASNTKYPSVKAVYDWAVALFSQLGHTHSAPDASVVTYTPSDNTKWTGSADPGDTDDALNQLASRTTTLEATSGAWTTIKKTADESKTNNTIGVDDTLQFTMAANTKYSIRIHVYGSAPITPDFKFDVNGPASPTIIYGDGRYRIAPGTLTAFFFNTYAASANAMASGASDNIMVEIDMLVQNGANAGTFSFRWAQNTTDATASKVYAGSYLEYLTM